MSRRRRHTLIFVALALLTILTLVTAHAPVVAWVAIPDNAPRGERVAGRTFNVLINTTCFETTESDVWEFQRGGHLVGQTIGPNSIWSQTGLTKWGGFVSHSCADFFIDVGSSFGPVMFGIGHDINANFFMVVVGIRT